MCFVSVFESVRDGHSTRVSSRPFFHISQLVTVLGYCHALSSIYISCHAKAKTGTEEARVDNKLAHVLLFRLHDCGYQISRWLHNQ